jgi:hypothetical protein
MPPHPCVRVAVDERQLIPRPHPQGHQVKAEACTLWREPVPCRQLPRWRAPSPRRKHQARLRGNRLAPPRFGCRHWTLAARCEPRNPARTTPSHVPMMPVARCRKCDARGSRAGPGAVEPLLTCTLTFTRCRRRSPIVDLRRPGHGLEHADKRRITPWPWRRSVPPLDVSLLERPITADELRLWLSAEHRG